MRVHLVLLLLALGVPAVWAEIEIQNDQAYFDDGILYIVGEVDNGSDVPLSQLEVHATVHSPERVIGTASARTLLNNIMPGITAPFEIAIGRINPDDLQGYALDFEYKVAAPKSQAIDITSSELSRDGFGNLVITGTVSNGGEITANAVSVIATLYDVHGNIAAVSKAHTKPDYLRASEESFFLIHASDKEQIGAVDYALVAESEEYAAVPEFPLGSGILFASSFVGYAVLSRYWNGAIAGVAAAADPA